MPVPTPELGLMQAVDADDTADYLVTNLANSLVSVDALFNNVAGHTHGGVHQGGPITSIPASAIPLGSITSGMIADGTIQSADIAPGAITSANISPPIDIPGMFRTHGSTGVGTGTGPGFEIYYTGALCVMQGFDRSTSLYLPVEVLGKTITLSIEGGTNFVMDATGAVTMSGSLTVTGTIVIGTGSYLFLGSPTHFILGSGPNVAYAVPQGGTHIFQYNDTAAVAPINCGAITASGITATTGAFNSVTIQNGGVIDTGPAQYVRISQLTVTPGVFVAANSQINGTLTVSAAVSMATLLTVTGAVSGSQFTATGTGYYFINNSVSIVWDNTYLRHSHSIAFNTTGNQIVWPNGSFISGNAGYSQGSQRSLKEGVAVVPDTDLMVQVADPGMPISTYYWPDDPDERQNIGFMADDVANVLPSYVIRDEGGVPVGYNPQELTAILWGAVRDLNARCVAKGI